MDYPPPNLTPLNDHTNLNFHQLNVNLNQNFPICPKLALDEWMFPTTP